MIDSKLLDYSTAEYPRMNKELCDGISTRQLKEAEYYIDDVWRSIATGFPEGLRYMGYRKCTPTEEFSEVTKASKPRRYIDLLRSDVRMFRYDLQLETPHGIVDIRPRFIYLPFGEGGLMYLRGTQYSITAVTGGRSFDVEKGKIYLANRAGKRMMFQKELFTFILNGRACHSHVINSPLHNADRTERVTNKQSLIVHYMLAEMGITKLFKKYYDIDVIVGGPELDSLMTDGEFFVARSRGISLTRRGQKGYRPSKVRIAITAKQYKKEVDTILASIFYILDHYPDAIGVEDMNDPDMWLRLLSRFIFKQNDSDLKSYESMLTHRETIRRYMDTVTKKILLAEDIYCDDIYDLFSYINYNFQDMVIHEDIGSMYHREINVVRHVLYNVVYNLFTVMFDLQKLQGDRITLDRITNILNKKLRRDEIFKVARHKEMSANAIACEAKPYGATCNLISQTEVSASSNGRNKHNNKMNDPEALLHISQMEVGTFGMMSKADPTGRDKANPFIQFRKKDYLDPAPHLVEYFEELDKLLTKRG